MEGGLPGLNGEGWLGVRWLEKGTGLFHRGCPGEGEIRLTGDGGGVLNAQVGFLLREMGVAGSQRALSRGTVTITFVL